MVLALIAVLFFAYIAFLGMQYHEMSESNTPICYAIGILLIVSLCCFGMCYGRATRNKLLGGGVQIFLGIIIFGTLISGAFPFTNFLDVLGKSKEIKQNVEDIFVYANDLDNRYAEYADSRIKDYEYVLSPDVDTPQDAVTFVNTMPKPELDYEVKIKSQALRRLILPESRKPIIERRKQWLNECKEMSLWNVATPENLRNLNSIVSSWIDEYRALSSKGFEDESFEPFKKEDFTSSMVTLLEKFTHYHFPSILAIFLTILVFGIILLPYILTNPFDGDKYDVENGQNQKKGKKEFTWI